MSMKVGELRKKYPVFVYKEYSYALKKGDLHIAYDFAVGEIAFRPKVVIKDIPKVDIKKFDHLIFQLGLAEMPSYWKATASPKIIIEAGKLNKAQIGWWHDLFMRGMGQYFYENKIDFTKKNFLAIESRGEGGEAVLTKKLSKRILVPVGGGKDAVVTLELLKKAKQEIRGFVLNPKKEQKDILRMAGGRNPIVVQRTIDPKLLELNSNGYLNGHTPFSAYLAFLTTLCAALFDYKYIALSNERSSNEGNVKYLGYEINHQYSKSFEFEKKFRAYSEEYLAKDIEYFSFLRPLYELQIAKLFANYPKYFATFLSCNEAHKTNSGKVKPTRKWCGVCSKCLFVFTCLYPFVETKKLVKIFASNLLENRSLIPLMEELTGKRGVKPFECVGTARETRAALSLQSREDHPLLHAWNSSHAMPAHLEKYLRSMIQ
jgi:UDP-N-acetyl-alpha-D-muramoyl-L-alanyl-L-glutamate epimerase